MTPSFTKLVFTIFLRVGFSGYLNRSRAICLNLATSKIKNSIHTCQVLLKIMKENEARYADFTASYLRERSAWVGTTRMRDICVIDCGHAWDCLETAPQFPNANCSLEQIPSPYKGCNICGADWLKWRFVNLAFLCWFNTMNMHIVATH